MEKQNKKQNIKLKYQTIFLNTNSIYDDHRLFVQELTLVQSLRFCKIILMAYDKQRHSVVYHLHSFDHCVA